MNRAKKSLFLFWILFLLISCRSVGSESFSNGISSEAAMSETVSSETSADVSTSYGKDEDGFLMLPEEEYRRPLSLTGDSRIEYADFVDLPSSSLRLYQEGKRIPLYAVNTNASQTWVPNNYVLAENSVGIVEKDGPITLVLSTNFALTYGATIRPLAKEVDYTVDKEKRLIVFTIVDAGQYTIEFRPNRTLHLFVDEIGLYDSIGESTMYFGAGIHNRENDSRINAENKVVLSSNQTVFIDYGAVVQASFVGNYAENVRIIGGGIVSGASFERDAEKNTQQIPFDFNYCKNLHIEGISCLDPAGWAYNIYFCQYAEIVNVKVISSRSNGDGISLQSCQDVRVSDSFIRTWDDSLVVKNYPEWSDRSKQGTTRNIFFERCLLWTDLAQSMEIGYETVGQVMDNISFDRITVLHSLHKAAISIHNGNNAAITNVRYSDIVIEDASMGRGDGSDTLIEITCEFSSTWSTKQGVTELGSIGNITFENIAVISGRDQLKVHLRGSMDTRAGYDRSLHYLDSVVFKNVRIIDRYLDEDYPYLFVNEYVRELSFE